MFHRRSIWMTKPTYQTDHPSLMKILCVKGSIHMINVIFTIYEINLVFSNMNISCSMKQRSCTLILVTLVKHCSFVWHKNRSSNQPKDIGLSCTTVFLYTTTFTSLLYHLYNTYSIEYNNYIYRDKYKLKHQ